MKFKDLLGVSLVSIFLFPVVLVGIMLATGVVHLEAGDGKDKERLKTLYTGADVARQEEAEARQFKTFQALQLKEKELRDREAEVGREAERLETLKRETMRVKAEIAGDRKRIEAAVERSAEARDRRIASLAEVYGGMRPDEAAPILLSLDNATVVRIMKKIPEARSASKLLASLAALDVKRAAVITKLMGGRGIADLAASAGDGAEKPGGRIANAGAPAESGTNASSPAGKNGPGNATTAPADEK